MRILPLALALLATPLAAQDRGSPLIDYAGFRNLTAEVQPLRSERLISLSEFKVRATKADVLILDARSAQAFAEGHIAGAVNLPLPDFTAESLSQIIGANSDREILIYCNNNFTNNRRPVVTKLMGDANGRLNTEVWDRTVQALLDQKILTKAPEGGYTTDITDKL